MDLVNMPDTIDYEVDKIAWRQGLPPGEGRPQLSGLDLADSDSDSSDNSIPSMCLDGLDRDAWMPDAEEAQDNMQVGEADRVNDPAAIPWRTTAWSAGAEDVVSTKTAQRAGESCKLPSSAQRREIVRFELQVAEIGENDDGDGGAAGGVPLGRGRDDDEEAANQRGNAFSGNATTEWAVLSDDALME